MTNPRRREGFVDDHELDRLDRPEPPFERNEPTTRAKQVEERPVTNGGAEPSPAPVGEVWPMVIKLRKPIQAENNRTLTELSLREPTTSDIMNAGGNPCRIEIVQLTGNQVAFSPIIDDGKMLRLIAHLADVLEPFLKRLDPRDYNTVAYQLRRFFLPEGKLW